MAQANDARDARPRAPLQIGVGQVAADGGRLHLRWQEQAGGSRTTAVAITSPVAMGLRVGLSTACRPVRNCASAVRNTRWARSYW